MGSGSGERGRGRRGDPSPCRPGQFTARVCAGLPMLALTGAPHHTGPYPDTSVPPAWRVSHAVPPTPRHATPRRPDHSRPCINLCTVGHKACGITLESAEELCGGESRSPFAGPVSARQQARSGQIWPRRISVDESPLSVSGFRLISSLHC